MNLRFFMFILLMEYEVVEFSRRTVFFKRPPSFYEKPTQAHIDRDFSG